MDLFAGGKHGVLYCLHHFLHGLEVDCFKNARMTILKKAENISAEEKSSEKEVQPEKVNFFLGCNLFEFWYFEIFKILEGSCWKYNGAAAALGDFILYISVDWGSDRYL